MNAGDLASRLAWQRAKEDFRARKGRAESIECLVGDPASGLVWAGGGSALPTTDLPGNRDTIWVRPVDALDAPAVIARNPSRKEWLMDDLVTCDWMMSGPGPNLLTVVWYEVPMGVFWIAGAVPGQTPGLFTPAHQFEFPSPLGGFDVAPNPLIPYAFYVKNGDFVYRVTPEGVIDVIAGGGSGPTGGLIVSPATNAAIPPVRTLDITPGGNGVMVGLTAEPHEIQTATDVIPDPFNPPNDTTRFFIRYEYDEVDLYSLEFTSPIQIRHIRLRMRVDYDYIIYVGLPPLSGRSDGGVIPSPYAELLMLSTHFNFARYNPVNGLLFVGGDTGHIITVPWNPATIPPASDPIVDGVMHFFSPIGGMVDIAFNAAGNAYIASAGQVFRWNYETNDSSTLVAGDGVFGGPFPAEGALATSGNLGQIGGIAFDALGRLLIACNGSFPEGSRLAAVNLTTGAITTLTGFGREDAATENLVEPLATAVFTGMNSLQADVLKRLYVGGEQVKRVELI